MTQKNMCFFVHLIKKFKKRFFALKRLDIESFKVYIYIVKVGFYIMPIKYTLFSVNFLVRNLLLGNGGNYND